MELEFVSRNNQVMIFKTKVSHLMIRAYGGYHQYIFDFPQIIMSKVLGKGIVVDILIREHFVMYEDEETVISFVKEEITRLINEVLKKPKSRRSLISAILQGVIDTV